MEFEWHEPKRLANIQRHSIDFFDVWEIFENDHIQGPARLGAGGEERFFVTGIISGIYVTGVFTMRGTVVRVISIRRARQNERQRHQEVHGC
jgi:uncharacterized DUF497 family protein